MADFLHQYLEQQYGDFIWFRRREWHPSKGSETAAQKFCAEVSTRLDLQIPTVHWSERVAWSSAKTHVATCARQHGLDIEGDPIESECAYFYWVNLLHEPGGYTYWQASSRIMIRSDLDLGQTLNAIAHECKHLNRIRIVEPVGDSKTVTRPRPRTKQSVSRRKKCSALTCPPPAASDRSHLALCQYQFHIVIRQLPIGGEERERFRFGLRDQHAVEGVIVMAW